MKLARWRPVCPECGYSLRGLTQPRCPECGIDFPTTSPTFRRWAVRRLPWDRLKRAGLIRSYLTTILLIFFCPCRAARGAAVPDHWGRAIRWAAVHLLLAAVVATFLADGQGYVRWVVNHFRPDPFRHPYMFMYEESPADRVVIWTTQSLLAWVATLTVFPLIGSLVSLGVPGRHRAAKLTGAKSSLYLSPVVALWIAVWYGYHFINPPVSLGGYELPPPTVPVSFLMGVYALWWASVMACNPYARSRGIGEFLLYVLLFVAVWAGLAWGCFRTGPLETLL